MNVVEIQISQLMVIKAVLTGYHINIHLGK